MLEVKVASRVAVGVGGGVMVGDTLMLPELLTVLEPDSWPVELALADGKVTEHSFDSVGLRDEDTTFEKEVVLVPSLVVERLGASELVRVLLKDHVLDADWLCDLVKLSTIERVPDDVDEGLLVRVVVLDSDCEVEVEGDGDSVEVGDSDGL